MTITAPSPVERRARLKECQRMLAQSSLHEFVKQAWHVIEPELPYSDNWHIGAICAHLEAVMDGRIPQLLINVPPGTMKSLLVCVFWPAWTWTTKPEKRFMFSSYSETLALRDSLRCRNILTSDWYQERWRIELKDDQNTKGKFENDAGGWRIAGSTGGKGTGEHPDINCLHPDSLILTEHGNERIKDIVRRGGKLRVLTYNHSTAKTEWKRVKQFQIRLGRSSVRVVTASGRSFICTENHPIYTINRGYIAAASLLEGDQTIAAQSNMFDLRECISKIPGASEEVPASFLFKEMPIRKHEGKQASSLPRGVHNHLSVLQKEKNNARICPRQKDSGILFSEVSSDWTAQAQDKVEVLNMLEAENAYSMHLPQPNLLLETLRFNRSSENDSRERKREMGSREERGAVSCSIPEIRETGPSIGWQCLREMWNHTKEIFKRIRRASHRLPETKQRLKQSIYMLPLLSRTLARESEESKILEKDFIISVESASQPDAVYNLSIEGNENYFADGILMHNCSDDPHNVLEAESEKERWTVTEWIKSIFSTRGVSRKCRRVVVMQRLHAGDASGHLLEMGGYDHICLPMRYEAPAAIVKDGPLIPRMKPTRIGFNDPRTVEGELLWPSLYPDEAVATMEINLGLYHCNPYEAPILMGDLTMKPIGEIKEGDEVVGWARREAIEGYNPKFMRPSLTKSKVKRVFAKIAEIVQIEFESGEIIRCTPEHKWYRGERSYPYSPAYVGSSLRRICPPLLPTLTFEEQRMAGWLCGFYDGEGHVSLSNKNNSLCPQSTSASIVFTQSAERNKPLCDELEKILKHFGFNYTLAIKKEHEHWQRVHNYRLKGNDLPMYQRFLHIVKPHKWKERILAAAYGCKFVIGKEKVKKITPCGRTRVYALETTTGNYVAWGLASSNSAGQLQQRPSPRGGGKFKRVWFEILPACPPLKRLVRYWDKAGTVGGSGAATAGVLVAEYDDPSAGLPAMRNKYIILDVVQDRLEAAEREALIKQTASADRARWGHVDVWVEQEPGSGGKESAQGSVANLAGFTCYIERVTGSKEVRADPVASQASVGKVKMLAGEWNSAMLDELSLFPLGKLKDMVDGLSGAFNKLFAPSTGIGSASEFAAGKPAGGDYQMETEYLKPGDM